MKKTFRYVLMAALTVGLSLAATSCKDDDKSDNNGGENMEQLESTGGEVSMEDIQLSTLISNFAEVQADELLAQSGWQSKTYEATLGLVLDESRPTVRTIEVGTIEAADERAEAMLRELGIDGQSPSGFTFSSASVGTVSYQHSGSDANTLAVINLDVRQLPGISQLRMVKALPANDGTFGYYGRGDIVKKDGRLWICTTPATKKGDYAYFVSFWTRHRTDNCRWGTYKDVVYLAKDEMASGFTDVYVARENDLENIEDGDFGDELKNKPDDETGVYQPGDMVEDETGTKWLCVWGAAHSIELGLSDKTAWFISFDNISNLNNMPQGIIEENDVVQLAVRFASAIFYTTSSKHNDILFKGAGQLGLWQSAYDNAGIDMSKMWVMRDSTWTFNSRGETRNSKTTSLFTNLAYRASDGTLRLLRTIADGTQGGTERNNCYDIDGKKHDMWQYLMYKRYEYYDPQQMRDLTNAEKGLGMTTWNIPWKMWDDKMNFGDLSIQEKVDKFAANDKWVTLPLAGKTNRQQPRTSANSDLIRWQNYMWSKNDKNFYNSNAKSMFNEPVLIMRLMKVNDQGGKRPYLKSQDGRKLKVVKMLDNEQMYVGIFNRIQNQLLKQYTSGGDLQSVYLDNEQYIIELN